MDRLIQNWWMFAVRGVVGILFGVLVFLWPGAAWLFLISLFAAYALLDGCFALAAAFSGHAAGRRPWALAIEGILGISAGVLTILWPGITELVLLSLIAFWSLATGIFEIVAAFHLRKQIKGEWLLILSGALSVLFGVALVVMPFAGLLAIAWLIAAYSITFGSILLALGLRLRSWGRRHAPAAGQSKAMAG